jgi:hypothetical protein
MQQRVLLGYQPQIIQIGIHAPAQEQIHVTVSDPDQVNTFFTDRVNTVKGNDYFYIRLPLAPRVALVNVYHEKTGPSKANNNFSLIGAGMWRLPLERKTALIDIRDPEVRAFVSLGQRFSYHAGHLPAVDYREGKIHFRYKERLTDKQGNELNTPAQTGEIDGVIEISQRQFVKMTVPMRFAILCHEFAHYYLNRNMYSEVEADLQGLNIYLALGYPRYDGYNAFLETFKGVPAMYADTRVLNEKRKTIIKKFIDDFENHKYVELYEKKK